MAIEIETSSDTVEQVKVALGSSIEIEESQPEAAVAAEEVAEPEAEAVEAEEDDAETAEVEDGEEPEPKPAVKKKAVPATVPRSRLNEEIEKRRRLEGQLEEARRRPAAAAPAASEEVAQPPQNYCGRPKPKISDYTDHPDKYPDPYASHAEDYGEWVGDERDAKRVYTETAQLIQTEERERTQPFRDRLQDIVKERPDYNDIVLQSTAQVSDYMAEFATGSEYGPDILLYFSEYPEEADKIHSVRGARGQMKLMEELEERIKNGGDEPVVTTSSKAQKKPVVAAAPAPTKQISRAPAPTARLKVGGAAPRTLQELAGPTDNQGVDIEYNPDYTKAVKARRRASL